MIFNQGLVDWMGPDLTRFPIGFSFGQYWQARVWSTIATGRALSSSESVKLLPDRMGISRTRKCPGLTAASSATGECSESAGRPSIVKLIWFRERASGRGG